MDMYVDRSDRSCEGRSLKAARDGCYFSMSSSKTGLETQDMQIVDAEDASPVSLSRSAGGLRPQKVIDTFYLSRMQGRGRGLGSGWVGNRFTEAQ